MNTGIKFFKNKITSWGGGLTPPTLLPVAVLSCWFVVSVKLQNGKLLILRIVTNMRL